MNIKENPIIKLNLSNIINAILAIITLLALFSAWDANKLNSEAFKHQITKDSLQSLTDSIESFQDKIRFKNDTARFKRDSINTVKSNLLTQNQINALKSQVIAMSRSADNTDAISRPYLDVDKVGFNKSKYEQGFNFTYRIINNGGRPAYLKSGRAVGLNEKFINTFEVPITSMGVVHKEKTITINSALIINGPPKSIFSTEEIIDLPTTYLYIELYYEDPLNRKVQNNKKHPFILKWNRMGDSELNQSLLSNEDFIGFEYCSEYENEKVITQ